MSTRLVLANYTPSIAQEAFKMLLEASNRLGGLDIGSAFSSTTKLHEYCKVVVGNDGYYAVIYPDFDTFDNGFYARIHAVLSNKGVMSKYNQCAMLGEYVDLMFDKGFHKLAIEAPKIARLSRYLAEKVGFQLEGIKRGEWPLRKSSCDVYYYGMLRSDPRPWSKQHGKEEEQPTT